MLLMKTWSGGALNDLIQKLSTKCRPLLLQFSYQITKPTVNYLFDICAFSALMIKFENLLKDTNYNVMNS